MLRTTIGQLLINSELPVELRDYNRQLDKKSVSKLFQQIIEKYPDKYKDIAKRLMDIGHTTADATGGQSFGLEHMLPSPTALKLKAEIDKELEKIVNNKTINEKRKNEEILKMVMGKSKDLNDQIYNEALASNNPLGEQVLSGSRGNPTNLSTLKGFDKIYVDHKERPLPIPITNSYAAGLSPVQYWAGTYGARKGVIDTKEAVRDAGAFSKQTNQASHRLVVTAYDADDPKTLHNRGLPVETNDADNEGSLLAQQVGPYKRDTILTPKILQHLIDLGHEHILVRSPAVSGSPEGGIYSKDVGIREKGILSPLGDNVGIAASSAITEPLSQSQLCLVKGTEVKLPDNSFKKIEDINVGDIILGADKLGNTFPVKVLNTYTNGLKQCYEFIFKHNAKQQVVVKCTIDHKLLSIIKLDGKTVRGKFPISYAIHQKYNFRCILSKQSSVNKLKLFKFDNIGLQETFDIEVDHPDHLFLIKGDIIVSNSSKHSGGIAGAAKGVSGFKLIDQLVQVPKHFKGGAAHASIDGKVQDIQSAPAGGYYVTIGNKPHYISAGFEPKIKVGDTVEAGDILSDGIPNPSKIVEHKGIGEGRRYFIKALRDAYKDAGIGVNRRNIELVARGLINHVRMMEEMGEYSPDDVVQYSQLEHDYEPRRDAVRVPVKEALDHYLEAPILHHSIGTKIRPSTIKELQKFNIKDILVHKEPVPFEPEMIRGAANLTHDPDWMTKMLGSNLKKGLLTATHRGAVSDEGGTSFVPGLARAVEFGRHGVVRDWHEADKKFKAFGKIKP